MHINTKEIPTTQSANKKELKKILSQGIARAKKYIPSGRKLALTTLGIASVMNPLQAQEVAADDSAALKKDQEKFFEIITDKKDQKEFQVVLKLIKDKESRKQFLRVLEFIKSKRTDEELKAYLKSRKEQAETEHCFEHIRNKFHDGLPLAIDIKKVKRGKVKKGKSTVISFYADTENGTRLRIAFTEDGRRLRIDRKGDNGKAQTILNEKFTESSPDELRRLRSLSIVEMIRKNNLGRKTLPTDISLLSNYHTSNHPDDLPISNDPKFMLDANKVKQYVEEVLLPGNKKFIKAGEKHPKSRRYAFTLEEMSSFIPRRLVAKLLNLEYKIAKAMNTDHGFLSLKDMIVSTSRLHDDPHKATVNVKCSGLAPDGNEIEVRLTARILQSKPNRWFESIDVIKKGTDVEYEWFLSDYFPDKMRVGIGGDRIDVKNEDELISKLVNLLQGKEIKVEEEKEENIIEKLESIAEKLESSLAKDAPDRERTINALKERSDARVLAYKLLDLESKLAKKIGSETKLINLSNIMIIPNRLEHGGAIICYSKDNQFQLFLSSKLTTNNEGGSYYRENLSVYTKAKNNREGYYSNKSGEWILKGEGAQNEALVIDELAEIIK